MYVRQSLKEQSTHSLSAQERWAVDLCGQKGWEPVVYREDGGHGDDLARPRLREMLLHARDKRIVRVVVHERSRLARGRDLLLILDWLKAVGAGVVIGDVDVGSDNADVVLGVLSAVDAAYLKTIRTHTKKGLAEAREKGVVLGRRPVGFTYYRGGLIPLPWAVEIADLGTSPAYAAGRFTVESGKHRGEPMSLSAIGRVARNVRLWREGRLESFLQRQYTDSTHGAKKRYRDARERQALATRDFEIWMKQNLPLVIDRVSL